MKRKIIAVFTLIVFLMSCLTYQKIYTAYAETISIGKAECVMELNSRRVLYAREGDLRLPMASTTKIITAITVLEHCDNIQEKVIIPSEAQGVEGSSVFLKAGDEYSVEDLLYGLMLRSGNDCAVALGLYTAPTIADFSALMNQTAQRAGALHTSLKNPHGLPCKEHYTTAFDLSCIACYALKNSTFKKIVATKYYEARHWKNKNKLLYLYDGGIGVKTGYTKEAGRCLVSAAQQNGMTLVATLLNCSQTYERSMQLFDDCFASFKIRNLLSIGDAFETSHGVGCVKEDFSYPMMDGEEEQVEIRVIERRNREIIGQIEIYLAKRLLFSTNLYKL